MAAIFTPKQGQYLAFIDYYTRLHRRPPAEADMQAYFRVSAPSVHQMIVALENRGLIQHTPGKARSIHLLLPPESIPDLGSDLPRPGRIDTIEATYPSIAAWITRYGWIEMGYDPNTDTFARALDEGGMVWSGGNYRAGLDENLRVMDEGIRDFMMEQGLK